MSETKVGFTPGPWEVVQRGPGYSRMTFVVGADPRGDATLAEVFKEEEFGALPREANARLIAAARPTCCARWRLSATTATNPFGPLVPTNTTRNTRSLPGCSEPRSPGPPSPAPPLPREPKMSSAKRVTMNEKRQQAIYDAVHTPIVDARIEVAKLTRGNRVLFDRLDELLFAAQSKAAAGAVRAAGGTP